MVESDLVDEDPLRLDAQLAREPSLEPDRDVAETDCAVASVEERARDDPDRVREVHEPRVRRGQLARSLGDPEHDRHRPQRLAEPAGPRRLLADAAARKRDRLVRESGLLAADPDLHEHEVGAFERTVERVGELQRSPERLALEHPPREAADDLEPLARPRP